MPWDGQARVQALPFSVNDDGVENAPPCVPWKPNDTVPPGGTEAPVETSRGARRGYRVPKEPFIQDPLL